MISGDIQIIDLNPYTWNNLGEIMDVFFEKNNILYILHDKENIINILEKKTGKYLDINIDFENLSGSIQHIFSEQREIDEIHVIELNSLIGYYKSIQEAAVVNPNMDIDEYMHFIDNLYHNYDGLNIYKRNLSHGVTFTKLKKILNDRPQFGDFTFGAIITENNDVYFDIILDFKDNKLKLMTSLEHLELEITEKISESHLLRIENAMFKRFGDNIKLICMEKSKFMSVVTE